MGHDRTWEHLSLQITYESKSTYIVDIFINYIEYVLQCFITQLFKFN